MKKTEAINKFRTEIEATMVESFRSVLESEGRIQYQIYIWEDGQIERLEGTYGDRSYLRPRDDEERQLFYICRVDWGYMGGAEITDIDEMVEDYESDVEEILDYVYLEAVDEERWDW